MSISRINNNLAALTASRNLETVGTRLSKNIERLSSGLRINRAGDDAAGLTIRERLRTQIRGSNQAMQNAQDGINMVNTAEGSLDSMVLSLQRIRELAIAAANTGSNDITAIQAIQDEVFQQIDEVNRIATTARFGTRILFSGDYANETRIKPGQEDVGVRVSVDPDASTLQSGTSILNIVKTADGSASLLPAKGVDGQAVFATGVKEATDIAVSMGRLVRGAGLAGERGAVFSDSLQTLTFDGVSIRKSDIITFQGVLSDGVTPFSGSLSINTLLGNSTVQNLAQQVQNAIDKAETALFGGIAGNIPVSFVQTQVSIPASAATVSMGSGRLRFLSAKAQGTTITTHDDITSASSNFQINFDVINAAGNVKNTVRSTRDFVKGQSVGGQYGNTVQAITGSTFNTGNFNIEVTDVTAASRKKLETTLSFRSFGGSVITRTTSLNKVILNGTFVNSVFTYNETGFQFESGDTITIQGTNQNGSTFKTVFTVSFDSGVDADLSDGKVSSLGGLVDELNFRDQSRGINGSKLQSGFRDATVTLTADGKLQLLDDVADYSQSNLFMIIDDHNTTRTLTDQSQLIVDGSPETATVVVDGGERQRVRVGDTVTLIGRKPTQLHESQPHLTLRVGSGTQSEMGKTILNAGIDTALIVGEEYVGSLNGGSKVTFQNGDQNVLFESGTSLKVSETLLLDFNDILDIPSSSQDGSLNAGRAILFSSINRALNFQIGAFKDENLQINLPNLRADNIGFGPGSGKTVSTINITTVSGADQALQIVDQSLEQISRIRSFFGAFTNRSENTINSLSVNTENLTASESRLSDVDITSEVSNFASNQVLYQAGISVLTQANTLPQGLLTLLR